MEDDGEQEIFFLCLPLHVQAWCSYAELQGLHLFHSSKNSITVLYAVLDSAVESWGA